MAVFEIKPNITQEQAKHIRLGGGGGSLNVN